MISQIIGGVGLALMLVGVVALNVWCKRHPMDREEQQDFKDEMWIW